MNALTPATGLADDVLLLTVPEVCVQLRISRWSFYQLVNRGQLETVKIGSRRLVTRAALAQFVAALPVAAGGPR